MDCSIYIFRKTDGSTARIDLDVPEDADVWTAIGGWSERVFDALDESMILGINADEHEDGLDAVFDEDDEEDVLDWLKEYEARVVLYDFETRMPLTVLKGFRGTSLHQVVSRARDYATTYIEGSGKDTAQMDVRVLVGANVEWSWQEASE